MPVIPQTGLPGGTGLGPGAGKKAAKLPGLKKNNSNLASSFITVVVAVFVAVVIGF